MKSATPQDTYDHVFGSGALQYGWWLEAERSGVTSDDNWSVTVTADDGNGGKATVKVDHALIMKTARYVLANRDEMLETASGTAYRAWSDELQRQCSNLIFRADDADLDAVVADELLQVAVLGKVVFG